jgi:DNA-binding MarR family transcriptional regulator
MPALQAPTALRRAPGRVTLPTLQALEVLLSEPGRADWCASELSREAGLPVSTSIQVLRRLEAWGWMTRRWEDADRAFAQGRPRRHLGGLTRGGAEAARKLLDGEPVSAGSRRGSSPPGRSIPPPPEAQMPGPDRWDGTSLEVMDVAAPADVTSPAAAPVRFVQRRTRRGRVVSVPNRLFRLPVREALARVVLPLHINWSEPGRSFDLSRRRERARAYEMLLREGRPEDLLAFVDGALLVDLWPELVLPADVRAAWELPLQSTLGQAS